MWEAGSAFLLIDYFVFKFDLIQAWGLKRKKKKEEEAEEEAREVVYLRAGLPGFDIKLQA